MVKFADESLTQLCAAHSVSVYRLESGMPAMVSLYLRSGESSWQVEWDDSNVAPRFDVFHLRVSSVDRIPECAEGIADLDAVNLKPLVKFDWLERVSGADVPDGFEPVAERAGKQGDVPSDAIVVAASVCGIMIRAAGERPVLLITIDETRMYSVAATSDAEAIREALIRAEEWPIEDWGRATF
jgi:hypothetical protein